MLILRGSGGKVRKLIERIAVTALCDYLSDGPSFSVSSNVISVNSHGSDDHKGHFASTVSYIAGGKSLK